ncbi:MAG: dTMP kinase [Clostridia bacterium]|nr:dTMP kinase [Clostridia bacterium]
MSESKRGKFITFEGCDGSGKSTQIEYFKKFLTERKIPFITTREPGGGKISEAIRSIILDGKNTEMTDECEALLYAAARVQHLKDTVEPALSKGITVLCDRYFDSSFAYQAVARGLGEEFVAKINAFAIERYTPDATVFINLSARDAFARKHGADENDRLEQAGASFHDKVYQGFLNQAEKYPERFIVVDGKQSKEEIFQSALKGLKEKGIL